MLRAADIVCGLNTLINTKQRYFMNKMYEVKGTESFEIDSAHVGGRFEIGVAPPLVLSTKTTKQPPRILYVLDGDLLFPTVSSTTMMLCSDLNLKIDTPFLVVGIGYPADVAAEVPMPLLRNRDLVTPGAPLPDWVVEALGGDGPKPAADKFLSFIEQELDPLIREKYEVSEQKAVLFGDSYGGLFGLYALFRQSPAFDSYILGSPGAVLENDPVFDVESERHAQGGALAGDVYMCIGEYEQPDFGTHYATLGKNMHKLADILQQRDYPGLTWSMEVLPGETHASVIGPAFARGMRKLFGADSEFTLSSVPQIPE